MLRLLCQSVFTSKCSSKGFIGWRETRLMDGPMVLPPKRSELADLLTSILLSIPAGRR